MSKKFFVVGVVCSCLFLTLCAEAMKPGTRFKKVQVPENFYDSSVPTMVKKCKVDSVYCDTSIPEGRKVSNQLEGCIDASGDNNGFVTDWEVNRFGPMCD